MSDEMREVRVRLDTGKVLRILTNDLVSPAHEIAEIYKQRWQIELSSAGSSSVWRSALHRHLRDACAFRSPLR